LDRLQQLSVFRRVVETGNITRAARDLAMSQPNVSRIVAELEGRLGVPLLLRSPRGLAATEAGQAFYSDAVRVLDALEEAEASVRGNQAALEGPLRVACSAPLFNRVVMPWLPGFLEENPGLSFEARLESRLSDLVEEGLDLAVRVGVVADQSLIARRLGRIAVALFAAPGYLRRHGTPPDPAALAGHGIVMPLLPRQPAVLRLDGPGGEVAEVALPAIRLRATEVETVRMATAAGVGIGVMPVWSAAECVAAGGLVPVLDGWRAETKEVTAVWPATHALPRRVRAFLDLLVEHCRVHPGLNAPAAAAAAAPPPRRPALVQASAASLATASR
jgi:LysR family transcriptional regulator for bpeEF and oprC